MARPAIEIIRRAPVRPPSEARRISRVWRSYGRNPGAIFGTAVVLFFALLAIAADYVAPADPFHQDLAARLAPPGSRFRLGADALGRDILSQIIYGSRVSLIVGVLAIVISVVLGTGLGLVSGFYGRRVDSIVMRAADMQLSLPTLLVALAAAAVWGPGLWKLIVIIGIVGWAEYGRTVRGSVLAVKTMDFVEAARAVGASDWRIMLRHILPSTLTPILILISVQLPRVIILEATLSFLGLGLPLTTPSLGRMISHGYAYLFSGAWWPSIMPGSVLMLIVMGINLLGDWLRDALDPRLAR